MPNHITTEVEIKGSEAKIKKLIKATKIITDHDRAHEDNQFDFNGIVKMPPELLNTTSPTTIVETQAEADFKNNEDRVAAEKNKWPGHTDRYLSAAEAERRQKEYGALNWYDWSNANWGTKWNAYEVHYTDHKLDGDNSKLVVQFDTAWDTPRELFAALEEQGFEVNGVYYGEMDGFEYIGDGASAFEVYTTVETEYVGE